MPKAKTPFFYARPDGSEGFVNAGEEVPEGVDAGDNVREDDEQQPATGRRARRTLNVRAETKED